MKRLYHLVALDQVTPNLTSDEEEGDRNESDNDDGKKNRRKMLLHERNATKEVTTATA